MFFFLEGREGERDEDFHDAGDAGDAGADEGQDEVEESDGEHNPYEVCYKINSRIANVVRVTCHTHVPCHMSHVTLTGCQAC